MVHFQDAFTDAGGPRGKWIANRAEKKQAHQLTLLKQGNPTLKVKKSRTVAQMDLITLKRQHLHQQDQTETDYTCSRITTNPPAKSKEGLTQQYNTDSDREWTRLVGRLQGRDKIRSSTN